MDILYPYGDAYEDGAKFTMIDREEILLASEVYGWSSGKKIDIRCEKKLDEEKKDKIEREIQLFRIREVYQVHNEFAERLLYSKNVLGKAIRNDILACINQKLDEREKIQEKEFNKFFYGIDIDNITKELKKEPLAKLTRDILM